MKKGKKLLLALLAAAALSCASFALASCGGGNADSGTGGSSAQTELAEIEGVVFEDGTFVYDGTEKSITASNIPAGVTCTYSGNRGTDAGTYTATAHLTGEGYEPLDLQATLTIEKADITGVTLEQDGETVYDGEYHAPALTGVPAGVQATFSFDGEEAEGVRAVGTYDVEVLLRGKNYNDLTLTCTYTVKIDAAALAAEIVDSFGSVPDLWAFLPESFAPENRAIASIPDYTPFVNVSSIPLNGLGKQMDVVYGLLTKTAAVLPYVNQVYAVMNTVKTLYTQFLDNNPEDYKTFTATAGGLSFTLVAGEDAYAMKASVGPVSVELTSSPAAETYGARVQLTEGTIFKYTVGPSALKVAMDILDTASTQIEFVREGDAVAGYLYEYLVAEETELAATSALLAVDAEYTYVIGTKGDFVPTGDGRNCEVYRNSDGRLCGTEVRETVEIQGTFNTLWYPLANVAGISSVRKTDEQNGLNADTVYINGAAEAIHTKLIGLSGGLQAPSRRFDIEFKTMYFYMYDAEEGDYESVSCEIPMIFIQEAYLDEFEDDFSDVNAEYLSGGVSLNVSSSVQEAVRFCYYEMLDDYDAIKESVSHDDIVAYCKATTL